METPLLRLANVGSADPYRLLYDLSDMLLRPLLYRLELADYTIQSITGYLLEMAQVLGIALCWDINHMVYCHGCDDSLGTCVSGLEPYCNSRSMDSHNASSNRNANNAPMVHIT